MLAADHQDEFRPVSGLSKDNGASPDTFPYQGRIDTGMSLKLVDPFAVKTPGQENNLLVKDLIELVEEAL